MLLNEELCFAILNSIYRVLVNARQGVKHINLTSFVIYSLYQTETKTQDIFYFHFFATLVKLCSLLTYVLNYAKKIKYASLVFNNVLKSPKKSD